MPTIVRLRAHWVSAIGRHRFDVLIDGFRVSDVPRRGRVHTPARGNDRGGWTYGWMPSEAETYLATLPGVGSVQEARRLLDSAPAPSRLEAPRGWCPESARKVAPMSGRPIVRAQEAGET